MNVEIGIDGFMTFTGVRKDGRRWSYFFNAKNYSASQMESEWDRIFTMAES